MQTAHFVVSAAPWPGNTLSVTIVSGEIETRFTRFALTRMSLSMLDCLELSRGLVSFFSQYLVSTFHNLSSFSPTFVVSALKWHFQATLWIVIIDLVTFHLWRSLPPLIRRWHQSAY